MWYHQHTLLIDLGKRYCEISLVEASSRSDCDWTTPSKVQSRRRGPSVNVS